MINNWAETSKKESEFKILETLMDIERFSFTEIQTKTKMSPNTINIRLKDLIEDKAVDKDEHGKYKITDDGRTKYYRLIEDLKSNKILNFNPRIVENIELKNIPLIATSSISTRNFEKEWENHLNQLHQEHLEFMKIYGIESSSCHFTAIVDSIHDKKVASLEENGGKNN